MNGFTDCWIDWLMDKIDCTIDGLNGWLMDWLVHYLIFGLAGWLMDWLTDWWIDWLIDGLNGCLIVWLMREWVIDWLIGKKTWILVWRKNLKFYHTVPESYEIIPGVRSQLSCTFPEVAWVDRTLTRSINRFIGCFVELSGCTAARTKLR